MCATRVKSARFACCGFSIDKKFHHSWRMFRHLSRHCWCKTAPQPNTSVFTACFNIPLTPIKIWASDNLLSCIFYHHYLEYVAFFACDFFVLRDTSATRFQHDWESNQLINGSLRLPEKRAHYAFCSPQGHGIYATYNPNTQIIKPERPSW